MKTLITVLAVLFTSLAQAQVNYDLTGRWGAGLGLGVGTVVSPDRFSEGPSEVDASFVGGLWGRYHLNKRLGFELEYARLAMEFARNTVPLNDMDPTADLILANVAYRMWATSQLHGLVQVGIGYARISDVAVAPDDSQDDLALAARIGAEYMATRDLMLAVHANYYHVNLGSGTDSEINVFSPGVALTYYFGGAGAGPVQVAKQAEAAKPDSDGDGIDDQDDQCPGTPAGQKVNKFGCADTEKIEITLNVQFASGSSKLEPTATADLEKFAAFLAKYPETKAEIEGHTDNTGSEKLNYSISQKRAEAVRNYLVKNLKVDKTRLTAKGYGPSQPVADNATAEGRTKNRRVVAHVTTTQAK